MIMRRIILGLLLLPMMMQAQSGIFTPARSMPYWAYLTTYINPMHYFVDAIRTVKKNN